MTKKTGKLKVNFSGVEARTAIPDGQYHARVAEADLEEGAKGPYIKWVFEIMEDKYKGRKVFTNTSLTDQALWNLRNLLETLGVEVPEDEDMDVQKDIIDASVDLELMVRIENEVWDGKERPKVTDYTPIDETAEVDDSDEDEEEDEEEEEKPAPAKKKDKKAAAKKEEPEEEEEEEEEDEEEEVEEEEEDGKMTADEIREMDEKELGDLVKTHKLKIDLSKISKAGKRLAAVIDAMEAKGLLGE